VDETSKAADVTDAPAARTKVLIVDHGTTVLPSIVQIVNDLGHEVQVCASGIAVIVAEGYRPDVAIFDIAMPGPYTCDLLTDFRRALPHIPVVLMGLQVDARTVEHLLNKEAFAYITKPFTPALIAGTLDAALRA